MGSVDRVVVRSGAGMEGEAFDPFPQSSMEREGKETEDVGTNQGSSTGEQAAETAQTWRDMVQAKGQALMEHPYVTQSAETVRQTLGQGTAAAQSRLQPIVGRTTGTVSSRLQPVMRKGAETVQLGKETARKIYNKEEGYEPAKVAPYLVISLGVLLLCILLAGQWLLTLKLSPCPKPVSRTYLEVHDLFG